MLLLPCIDEDELYKQFHLDEPWDSPHNIRLLPKMPRIFTAFDGSSASQAFTTYYQVFVGQGAAFQGKKWLRLQTDFPDGSSTTFLIVEAGEAVPWTKPQDLTYEADKPLPRLGGILKDGFRAAMADASARNIPGETSERTIRATITRNGNDRVGDDWWR